MRRCKKDTGYTIELGPNSLDSSFLSNNVGRNWPKRKNGDSEAQARC